MTDIYACVGIDPYSKSLVGHTVLKQPLDISETVIIKDPTFLDQEIEGLILDKPNRLTLKGLKRVGAGPDGEYYTFDNRMPLLTAAYALVNPQTGVVKYTNAR